MQQSKAYWQLAAPAGQHNGSSSCIFRAFSLALCASMQSGMPCVLFQVIISFPA